MNSFKLSFIALLSLLLAVSCSKVENNYFTVEEVTVKFESKELITKVQSSFNKKASINKANTATPFVHTIPSKYNAYFIASESRGQYKKDQLIKTIEVTGGTQEITIPELKYRVVVSSYGLADKLNNGDLPEHLPASSSSVHLYGENNISYIDSLSGVVEVKNPYAAIMVKNNTWVNGAPIYDTGSKSFDLVDNNAWYLLYIRIDDNNSQKQIRVPVPMDQVYYTIKDKFNANTIYQYTFNGVGDIKGNFTVAVGEIFKTVKNEVIDLY